MTVYNNRFDFNNIDVRRLVIHNSSTAPATPVVDQLWTDTSTTPHVLKMYDGATWVAQGYVADDSITDAKINSAAGIALSKLATDPLARANHTGTQTASTISDLASVVQAYRLDQFAAATADLDLGGFKLTGLDDATAADDAVNLRTLQLLVDGSRAGFRGVKDPVRVAAAGNVNLASPGAIDGVTLTDGQRFLAPSQSTASENGIYEWHAGGATRSADAASADVGDGTFVAVGEGTQAGYVYVQRADVSGGAAQDWGVFQAGGINFVAGAGLTLTGSTFSLPTVDIARGGTGATTAAQARLNLGVGGAYGETVTAGDFAPGVPVTITHGLNTIYIGVYTTSDSTGDRQEFDWRVASANTVEVLSEVPVSDDINVAVFGA